MADRALRELKQIGKINSDRIVRVLDQGRETDGTVFVVTERPEGHTLDQVLATSGVMSLERAKNIVLQIGEALTEAQKVGVIHRRRLAAQRVRRPGRQGQGRRFWSRRGGE